MAEEVMLGAGREKNRLPEYARAVEELKQARREIVELLRSEFVEKQENIKTFPSVISGISKDMLGDFPEVVGAVTDRLVSELDDETLMTSEYSHLLSFGVALGQGEKVVERLKTIDAKALDEDQRMYLLNVLWDCVDRGRNKQVLQIVEAANINETAWKRLHAACEYVPLGNHPQQNEEILPPGEIEPRPVEARDFVIDNAKFADLWERVFEVRGGGSRENFGAEWANADREERVEGAARDLRWLRKMGIDENRLRQLERQVTESLTEIVGKLNYSQLQFLVLLTQRVGLWHPETIRVLEMGRFVGEVTKSGSRLQLMKAGEKEPIVLVNTIKESAWEAWMLAEKMGVPVAPILKAGRMAIGEEWSGKRVYSRYCGLELGDFFNLLFRWPKTGQERIVSNETKTILKDMTNRIKHALANVDGAGTELCHGHPHDKNFVIEMVNRNYLDKMLAEGYNLNNIPWREEMFKYDPRYLMDRDYATVLRLIDWDQARVKRPGH